MRNPLKQKNLIAIEIKQTKNAARFAQSLCLLENRDSNPLETLMNRTPKRRAINIVLLYNKFMGKDAHIDMRALETAIA